MELKFSEIPEGDTLNILLSGKSGNLTMHALLKKFIKEDIALISLDYDSSQTLNFENVHVEVEYEPGDSVPIIWKKAKIVAYRNDYILQTIGDAIKHNRRENFRVGVSLSADATINGNGGVKVLVRDISISGFSLTDSGNKLNLSQGDQVRIHFDDFGHIIDLTGQLVRIEEREDATIYGFQIQNVCKDLASYLSVKQRHLKGRL